MMVEEHLLEEGCWEDERRPRFQVYRLNEAAFTMLRSYHHERIPSHQNWVIKRDWASSVLGRVITWEPGVS